MGITGSVKGSSLHGNISRFYELRGYSAYEVAVMNGFNGTEEEWIASLKGPQGDKGEPGEVIHTELSRHQLEQLIRDIGGTRVQIVDWSEQEDA